MNTATKLTFSQLDQYARKEAIETYIKRPLREEVRGDISDIFNDLYLCSDKAVEVTLVNFSASSVEFDTTILKDEADPITFAINLASNLKRSHSVEMFEIRWCLDKAIEEEVNRVKFGTQSNKEPLTSDDFVARGLSELLKLTAKDYGQVLKTRIDNFTVGHLRNELFNPDGSRA